MSCLKALGDACSPSALRDYSHEIASHNFFAQQTKGILLSFHTKVVLCRRGNLHHSDLGRHSFLFLQQ